MRILSVSTSDTGGGAQRVALDLHHQFRARGHSAWLAVGSREGKDPHTVLLDDGRFLNPWARLWQRSSNLLSPLVGRVKGAGKARIWVQNLGRPGRALRLMAGHEDFDHPATRGLLNLPSERIDILHAHNLHGGYFDLRELPKLSAHLPVVLTLHDAWLLSGHCAHSFDCERWKTGCGSCPDLTIYPAVPRDRTAPNWVLKRDIYRRSRFYLSTPSNWLMEKVRESMIFSSVNEARVIPLGIDLGTFMPQEKAEARQALKLPLDARIVLFVSNFVTSNRWKDFSTILAAVERVASRSNGKEMILLALGEQSPELRLGNAVIRFIPFQRDRREVARYYSAADLYVHAAHVDTFPLTILESLACGSPVVATAIGGIPEQIRGLGVPESAGVSGSGFDSEAATGILVPSQDPEAMAAALERLLGEDELRRKLGENAWRDAANRFSLEREGDDYLSWFREILLARSSA